MGANDLWIASHSLADDRRLVTNNTREFERVAGLRLENWAKGSGLPPLDWYDFDSELRMRGERYRHKTY